MKIPAPLALMAALASNEARAQDAHGSAPAPADGAVDAPLWAPSAELAEPHSEAFSVGFDYAKRPLVVRLVDGGEVVDTQILADDVLFTSVHGLIGVSDRLSIGATVPFAVWTTGEVSEGAPALGDVRLSATLGIVPSGRARVAAIPWASLPTGAESRALGRKLPTGGVVFAASVDTAPIRLHGELGAGYRPAETWPVFGDAKSGIDLSYGAGAMFTASEHLGIGAELRGGTLLGAGELLGSPLEALVGARIGVTRSMWIEAGGGPGLAFAAGTPVARGFVTVGWHSTPRDGVITPVGPMAAIHIVDPNGAVVRDAIVRVGDDEIAHTDANGDANLPDDLRWKRGVSVSAPGFATTAVAEGAPTVTMAFAPVPLAVRVTDLDGAPIPTATITLRGPVDAPTPEVDGDGRAVYALAPAIWEVEVGAPGMTTQVRDLNVPPRRAQPLSMEVVLAPAAGGDAKVVFDILDPDGGNVEGARVNMDGRLIGTLSNGHHIEVRGVVAGPHTIDVTSDTFRAATSTIDGGTAPPVGSVKLGFEDGTVIVAASGPDGAVVDALARFDGPSRLPPAPLGEDGRRVFVLRPGAWQLLVSSPALGMQTRDVTVPDHPRGPILVGVTLAADEQGDADLEVKALDREGRPLPDVMLAIDGHPVGSTSTGGAITLSALDEGPRVLTASGAHVADLRVPIELRDGYQEALLTMDWKPGTVEVSASAPDGVPVDAMVRFAGPVTAPGGPLGPSGTGLFGLSAGTWDVLASSEDLGMQTRTFDVAEGGAELVRVAIVMTEHGTGSGIAWVYVTDASGKRVEGAHVKIDGSDLGATPNSGVLRIEGLPTGTHRLLVEAPGRRSFSNDAFKIGRSPTKPTAVALDYAPGATRIRVVGPDGAPVDDAVLRIAGETVLPPMGVDLDGTTDVLPLSPGSWSVLVSSESQGLAEHTIDVPADVAVLNDQEIRLGTNPTDVAVLLVRVVEPGGAPVGGAEVFVDGTSRGRTTGSGAILVDSLPPGMHTVGAKAVGHTGGETIDIDLHAGSTQRFITVRAEPIPLDVMVRDPDGVAIVAKINFEGAWEADSVQTGADGFAEVELIPGTWSVFVTAPGLGVQRQDVRLIVGEPTPRLLFDLQKPKVELRGGEFVINGSVHFGLDETVITAEQDAILREVANTLRTRPDIVRVEVQGHSDSTGSYAYNVELSQKRAEVVRQALIERGVAPEVLVAHGYGPVRPIAENTTVEGQAKNRRVEFEVLEATESR